MKPHKQPALTQSKRDPSQDIRQDGDPYTALSFLLFLVMLFVVRVCAFMQNAPRKMGM